MRRQKAWTLSGDEKRRLGGPVFSPNALRDHYLEDLENEEGGKGLPYFKLIVDKLAEVPLKDPQGQPQRLYAVAEPVGVTDRLDSLPGSEALADLTRLGERYRRAAAMLQDIEPGAPAWSDDPELFSFQVAAELELSRSTQWRMLTLDLTDQRVALLLELLPSLLDEIAARAAIHVGARSNGKGPHGAAPDLA